MRRRTEGARHRLRRPAGPPALAAPAALALLAALLPWGSAAAQGTSFDDELAAELEAGLQDVLEAEGRGAKDPHDDGIAAVPRSGRDVPPLPVDTEFRDPRGTAVSKTTVMGLVLVCKTYARTAGAVADRFERIRNGGRKDKADRLARVEKAVEELAGLREAWNDAARDHRRLLRGAARTSGRGSDRDEVRLRRGLEKARENRETAEEAYLSRREELVGRLPELAVEVEGVPLWEAFAEFDAAAVETPGVESEGVSGWLTDRLAGLFDEGEPAPEAAKTQLYNQYLETGREALREEAEKADCGRTVEELWKYGSSAYRTTREAVKRSGGEEATLAADLMEELEANYEAYETHQKVDEGWTDVVMAATGALLIPLGTVACVGFGVVEIVKEGSDVVVAYRSAEEARTRAPLEGYRHVVSERERLGAEAGELAFTAVTVAPDFLEGVKTVRVARSADEACVRPPTRTAEGEGAPTAGGDGRPTGGERPPTAGDTPGDETRRLPEPDLPPADEAADAGRTGRGGEGRGARPREEVEDDPDYLDVGGPPDVGDAIDDLEEALERARAEGVSEAEIETAVGDLSEADADDVLEAAERVESLTRARTGCVVVERAPVREVTEIFTRTAGDGGRFHPEHFEWLRRMVETYPDFFDVLPNTLYRGQPLLDADAARRLERWFDEGRVRTPGPDELPAFGWSRDACDTDLPSPAEYAHHLEEEKFRRAPTQVDPDEAAEAGRTGEGGDPPVDSGAETPPREGRGGPGDPGPETRTGEAGRPGDEADEAPGEETRRLPEPELPPPADEAAAGPRTGGRTGVCGEAGAPRPLSSEAEYRSLVARQNAGEAIDLSTIARPGIARVLDDGTIVVAQGAGRWEGTRPDGFLDLFVDARSPLPSGPDVQVVESGVSREVVRQSNLLSSRGASGTNPAFVDLAVGDATEFVRVRVRARTVRAPTSQVDAEVETELGRLRDAGVDVTNLERALEPLSPAERLALLQDDAARRRAIETGEAARGTRPAPGEECPPAELAGEETRRLPEPELPPPADEAAAPETGDPSPGGGRSGGAAGQLGDAGRETGETEEMEEETRPEEGRPETGRDAGGGAGDTEVATGGFYETTEAVDPIDIVLTPIDAPEEDPPVTDPGDGTDVATGPETGGGEEGPTEGPAGGEGGDDAEDGTEVALNGAGAGEILNSPIATEGGRDPDVQAMIIESVDLEVAPAGPGSGGAGPGARGGEGAGPAASPPAAARRSARRAGLLAAHASGGRASGPSAPVDRGSPEIRPPAPQGLQPHHRAPEGPELEAYITSLGGSTGEAFRLHVLNRGSAPVSLGGDGLVVEPVRLEEEARRELEGRLRDLASENPVTRKLTGYCLEFLRRPPSPGRLFRIAGHELQERFAPARKTLGAARQVEDAGLLNPDSDPAGYFDSITQWAIWSDEQGFDFEGFAEAFLEHTRKNAEAAGRRWTDEVESAVEGLIPNRWEDVQRVLREAGRLPAGQGSP